ncbi:hypothetical protein C7M84_012108 [Penaeus vannamei]|uniref:Uncharacterized protein n=1 Tax=Penaeus vannamei TaxID=6689 RepID=A0A423SZR4_PENVA|nr:hypothetical protein C7M84_012108 [Penaeus vannamei]
MILQVPSARDSKSSRLVTSQLLDVALLVAVTSPKLAEGTVAFEGDLCGNAALPPPPLLLPIFLPFTRFPSSFFPLLHFLLSLSRFPHPSPFYPFSSFFLPSLLPLTPFSILLPLPSLFFLLPSYPLSHSSSLSPPSYSFPPPSSPSPLLPIFPSAWRSVASSPPPLPHLLAKRRSAPFPPPLLCFPLPSTPHSISSLPPSPLSPFPLTPPSILPPLPSPSFPLSLLPPSLSLLPPLPFLRLPTLSPNLSLLSCSANSSCYWYSVFFHPSYFSSLSSFRFLYLYYRLSFRILFIIFLPLSFVSCYPPLPPPPALIPTAILPPPLLRLPPSALIPSLRLLPPPLLLPLPPLSSPSSSPSSYSSSSSYSHSYSSSSSLSSPFLPPLSHLYTQISLFPVHTYLPPLSSPVLRLSLFSFISPPPPPVLTASLPAIFLLSLSYSLHPATPFDTGFISVLFLSFIYFVLLNFFFF